MITPRDTSRFPPPPRPAGRDFLPLQIRKWQDAPGVGSCRGACRWNGVVECQNAFPSQVGSNRIKRGNGGRVALQVPGGVLQSHLFHLGTRNTNTIPAIPGNGNVLCHYSMSQGSSQFHSWDQNAFIQMVVAWVGDRSGILGSIYPSI